MQTTLRLLYIFYVMLRHRVLFLLCYLPIPFAGIFKTKITKKKAKRVVKALENLGPVFIKLGQLLSSRSDIVGNTLAKELTNLQDNVANKNKIDINKYLENSLGIKVSNHFKTISKNAVASASVACVYKAETLSGKHVAIKVLNKNLNKQVKKDLGLIKLALKNLLSNNLTAERLKDIVIFIEKHFAFELDLRFEAASLEEFSEVYKDVKKLILPKIYWSFSNQNILTTEWIEGYKINNLPSNINKKQVADDIVRIFILQTLANGFFHADMHQGNIIVDKNGNICLIDFGITDRLDKRSKYYLARIFNGLLNKNYKDAAKAHIEAGYVSNKQSVEDFALACRAIASKLLEQKQEDVSISSLLTQLFEITKIFEMKVQTHLILLQKNMVMVEGLVKDLNPKGNVWIIARKYVKEIFENNSKVDKKVQKTYIKSQEIIEKVSEVSESIISINKILTNKQNKAGKNLVLKLGLLTVVSIFLYYNFIIWMFVKGNSWIARKTLNFL